MDEQIKFSIITPVYNRENTVANVIKSIVNQEYNNWELILVDDGSTDNTANICKNFCNDQIRYIYKKNGGVCTARNKGIINSTGNYILFLDSDNSLKQNTLSVLFDYLITCPQTDIICFGYDANSKWLPTEDDQVLISKEEIRKKYIPTHINIYPQKNYFLTNFVWNKCYQADFLKKNNILFDENRRTWEDGLFVVNCLDKANSLLIIKHSLYNAYCEEEVKHLSTETFKSQIYNYINDENDFKNRFVNEYDFYSQHYCRSNFNVLNELLYKSVKEYKDKQIIRDIINHEIVQFWINTLSLYNKTESIIIKYIKNRNVNAIYRFYRYRIIRVILSRI